MDGDQETLPLRKEGRVRFSENLVPDAAKKSPSWQHCSTSVPWLAVSRVGEAIDRLS